MKLNQTNEKQKNQFLRNLAEIIELNSEKIIRANKKDLELAHKAEFTKAFIERLELEESDLENIIQRLEDLQKLESGIGKIIEGKVLKNGLTINKVRTAIGVIAIIYESRPEVTIDAACLCIKSGNSVILKGGSEVVNTNQVLIDLIQESLKKAGIGQDSVRYIKDRKQFLDLIKRADDVDLVIARGGYELVKTITNESKVPVLAHSAGGARIYIDKSADLKIAENIIVNSKVSKPAACNSLDTILIHKNISKSFVKKMVKDLQNHGVEVLQDSDTQDWDREFLDLTLNIRIVEDISEAVEFIKKYSKGHTEGIIAEDKKVMEEFVNGIDSAAVFINCSTRFHDGFEFGMGAEMGIATGKLHARGPVGLKELTTYGWEVYGNGQTR